MELFGHQPVEIAPDYFVGIHDKRAFDVPEECELFSPEIPLDLLEDDSICFADFLEDFTDSTSGSSAPSKRKGVSTEMDSPDQKKQKPDSFVEMFSDLNGALLPACRLGSVQRGASNTISVSQQHLSEAIRSTPRDGREFRETSVESSDDSHVFSSVPICVPEFERTAEYHFQQIQEHAKLAIAALKHGRYERSKNIVTWAHDLKNKVAHEIKKEAEQAWEYDKDKEQPAPKLPSKKNVLGSTKRVEQFRKNMRRWMIGTQIHKIGVDWMVYARMEHLQAISKFILGPALPADPASPSAVADSINMYLNQNLPASFIDGELAEPEPGKRYVIGQGLAPYLSSQQARKVPTLAFTMPPEDDAAATSAWVLQLKELFPAKPAPKSKVSTSSRA